MADEGFLRRWSRLKTGDDIVGQADAVAGAVAGAVADAAAGAVADAAADAVPGAVPGAVPDALPDAVPDALAGTPAPVVPAAAALPPPPTLADAAALHGGSNFSPFVGRNVDAAVRRLAMKKLFSDPHFQGHDGLDIYMGDYTVASPVSPDMFEQLAHSKSVFHKLGDAIDGIDAALAPAVIPEAAPAETPPSSAPPDQEVA